MQLVAIFSQRKTGQKRILLDIVQLAVFLARDDDDQLFLLANRVKSVRIRVPEPYRTCSRQICPPFLRFEPFDIQVDAANELNKIGQFYDMFGRPVVEMEFLKLKFSLASPRPSMRCTMLLWKLA